VEAVIRWHGTGRRLWFATLKEAVEFLDTHQYQYNIIRDDILAGRWWRVAFYRDGKPVGQLEML
jgi:hypothetical protein